MKEKHKTPKLVYQAGRVFTKARLERKKRVTVGWSSDIEDVWVEKNLPDCLEEIEAVLVWLGLLKERKQDNDKN